MYDWRRMGYLKGDSHETLAYSCGALRDILLRDAGDKLGG